MGLGRIHLSFSRGLGWEGFGVLGGVGFGTWIGFSRRDSGGEEDLDTGLEGGGEAPRGEDELGTMSEGGGDDLGSRPVDGGGVEADLVVAGVGMKLDLWSSSIDWLTKGIIFLR